jgi:FecR protein
VCGRGGQQMAGVNFKTKARAGLAFSYASAVLAAGVLLFGGGQPSWSQEKIGGAQTVVNNVDGSLPTGNQMPVAQGDNVFLNEAVRSGADSRAKLVLNDSTNLTVGPDSTVKLDDFVYSGPKSSGTIALNMTKGTIRFITGDANKRAYTIWTPTAAIGVRGTNLLIEASDTETRVVNEEGTAIVCARKGNEYVTVNELRKRCKGREEQQTNITNSRKRSCPCTALLLPNQLATVGQDGILVGEAPLNAIADPFPEGFGFGGVSPFVGAGLAGAGLAAGIAAAEASSHSSSGSPFVPFVSP